jgi:hypothetical protein
MPTWKSALDAPTATEALPYAGFVPEPVHPLDHRECDASIQRRRSRPANGAMFADSPDTKDSAESMACTETDTGPEVKSSSTTTWPAWRRDATEAATARTVTTKDFMMKLLR